MADTVFEPLRRIQSRILAMPQEDVDTDQILPARFMTTAHRVTLADALFRDLRDGGSSAHARALDRIEPGTRRVLVAGRNFGAGSSREHAVWALVDFGFRVVISSRVADIFAGNAVRNGMLTIEVPPAVNDALLNAEGLEIDVDLLAGTLTVRALALAHDFHTDPFARLCLLEGRDPLAFLLGQRAEVVSYMERACVPWPDLRTAIG